MSSQSAGLPCNISAVVTELSPAGEDGSRGVCADHRCDTHTPGHGMSTSGETCESHYHANANGDVAFSFGNLVPFPLVSSWCSV